MFISFEAASSINIKCLVYNLNIVLNGNFTTIFQCTAVNQVNVDNPNVKLTKIEAREFGDGLNSSDVQSLNLSQKKMFFLPKGIEEFFPNLVVLMVEQCDLKEIRQESLKPFPLLKFLQLKINSIKVLVKDLFKFNAELQGIDLYANQIKEIDINIFDHLTKLMQVDLRENNCINNFWKGNDMIRKLIQDFQNICKPRKKAEKIDEVKIIPEKKFNWKKYFWVLMISGTTAVVLVVYGFFRFFKSVKVAPQTQE